MFVMNNMSSKNVYRTVLYSDSIDYIKNMISIILEDKLNL
jgi:hypothetical protein